MGEYRGPLPQATPETRPHWEALRKHRLLIQRCTDCRQAYFYPRQACPHCFSWNVEWIEASGRGSLYTFVINHRPPPSWPKEPFVIAVVELEEGPRMMANLVGVAPDPERIRCDAPVVIDYHDVTDDVTLPRFRLA